MKILFFNAAAEPHDRVSTLAKNVEHTLRPFDRYLHQAIQTAKQRQFRYQLPWRKVRDIQTFKLTPIDTVLLIPRKRPGVLLKNWPMGKTWDLVRKGFVSNRDENVVFTQAVLNENGLRVESDDPLKPADQVIWCGVTCEVAYESEPFKPREIRTLKGHKLNIRRIMSVPDGTEWCVVVEGIVTERLVLVDSERIEILILKPFERVSSTSDANGVSYNIDSSGKIRSRNAPAEGYLTDENDVRYEWSNSEGKGRDGCWIELLPSESEESSDESTDPRAAFCEGNVEEVWTQKRHSNDTSFRVRRVDQESYQLLLDRYPPEDTILYLPLDLNSLYLQRRAFYQLTNAPLPHHRGLLRLCQEPQFAKWPRFSPQKPQEWHFLTDATRDGTGEQREFVAKALGTPDFAFMEGPPGSGKTTAICDLINEFAAQGKRVLLCSTTHFAVDNVLEKLMEVAPSIHAVRMGRLEKVDDKVKDTQFDERVREVMESLKLTMPKELQGEGQLQEMAEKFVIMSANLTCGTVAGIAKHPLFRGRVEDLQAWERPITTMPHWDVLIVDEASKTLIQEFMVPALMAKRWIIVGDVKQLSPFTDREDLVANLRDLKDNDDGALFPENHQRACLILHRLLRHELVGAQVKWLVSEPVGVIQKLVREVEVRGLNTKLVVRLVEKSHPTTSNVTNLREISLQQVETGEVDALLLAAADWLLVDEKLLPKVSHCIPANFLNIKATSEEKSALPQGDVLRFRQAWWFSKHPRLGREIKDRKDRFETAEPLQHHEHDWFRLKTWAGETAWRLIRLFELRRSSRREERQRLRDALGGRGVTPNSGRKDQLLPSSVNIEGAIGEIEDIGLPSILEVLQEGIGEERVNRPSALTQGIKHSNRGDFAARFQNLSFQHRMHSDISRFSREKIYEGQALKDANTIQSRDENLGWNFGPFPARRVWMDIQGREDKGVNSEEVKAMREVLAEFIDWAKTKGSPLRDRPKVWEVACLAFYTKQERAISDMLQNLTKSDRKTRFEVRDAPVEIVCGTVDRFQGREADLVLLSMRNTSRTGFLDSVNRLNVAVTRARQQLIILGKNNYFSNDRMVEELRHLAQSSPLAQRPKNIRR